ncbi:hypothetical protein [Aneurinibacillus tyrosinisolvens]|uniref:hypothetical protein n=1 Tax=Aneurinibacillus tyrosinisolvens TaxID=1443435 RepID=UPI001F399B0A|nr:hypothetical protein [Aneurinibacillus tyrosinisolvens]
MSQLISKKYNLFSYWYLSEKSLNVNYISTRKVEVLYWIAFVLTRPFGATFGDLLTK